MDIGEMIGDDAYLFWEEQRGNLLRSVRFAAYHEHGEQLQGNISTNMNNYINIYKQIHEHLTLQTTASRKCQ